MASRVEDGDSGAVHTALREAEEEVGLVADGVSVLGALEPHGTISNYRVTPVVALAPPFESVPQAEEVANVFEVPFSFVLDTANHQYMERGRDGRSRATYAIPYGEWFIFGFTGSTRDHGPPVSYLPVAVASSGLGVSRVELAAERGGKACRAAT
jgi:8-oxo-dGTP pyrophosphatase MutT (NUDIX family)